MKAPVARTKPTPKMRVTRVTAYDPDPQTTALDYYSVPAQPGQPLLLQDLPIEILRLIVKHLDVERAWDYFIWHITYASVDERDGRRALIELSRVSRLMRSLTRPALFDSIFCFWAGDTNPNTDLSKAEKILREPAILQHITRVELCQGYIEVFRRERQAEILDSWARLLAVVHKRLQVLLLDFELGENRVARFLKQCNFKFPSLRRLSMVGEPLHAFIERCDNLKVLRLGGFHSAGRRGHTDHEAETMKKCIDQASRLRLHELIIDEDRSRWDALRYICALGLPIRKLSIESKTGPFERLPSTLAKILSGLPILQELRLLSMQKLCLTKWRPLDPGHITHYTDERRGTNPREGNMIVLSAANELFNTIPSLERLFVNQRQTPISRDWLHQRSHLVARLGTERDTENVAELNSTPPSAIWDWPDEEPWLPSKPLFGHGIFIYEALDRGLYGHSATWR